MHSRYKTALEFLLGALDYEKVSKYPYNPSSFDLSRMEAILNVAGNPHLDLKTIHVAGTKGKGSTSIMIASILMHTGLKVGLFTSPHLINIEERICINGKKIRKKDLCETIDIFRPYIENERAKNLSLSTTFFETLTAVSLLFFKKKAVDVAVMEVGLGGRLDATNIINPLVSVITSIGLDHTDKLGDTIEKIAMEKAGIIKDGTPVVSASQVTEALSVIENICNKKCAKLMVVGREIMIENVIPVPAGHGVCRNQAPGIDDRQYSIYNQKYLSACRHLPAFHRQTGLIKRQAIPGSLCNIVTKNNRYTNLFIPVPGRHQIENSACAIAAAEIAMENSPDYKKYLASKDWVDIVRDALLSIRCHGRIEVVSRRPLIIVDSAHTVESIRCLKNTLFEYFNPSKITLIIGISADKDIKGILDEIIPAVDYIIFTSTSNPRSSDPKDLVRMCKDRLRNNYFSTEDIEEGLNLAKKRSKGPGLICVTGSTYLAGRVKYLLQNRM